MFFPANAAHVYVCWNLVIFQILFGQLKTILVSEENNFSECLARNSFELINFFAASAAKF